MTWREQLETDGFALLPAVFTAAEVADAIDQWEAVTREHAADEAILTGDGGPAYGARNLLQLWPRVMELARHPRLRERLVAALGPAAGVVRVLFFDKPPGHSWALPWHKDHTIAVAEHGTVGTFTKLTTKAGVPHVMAPFGVLSAMLTARIHLDAMNADNGQLRVIPGSHRCSASGGDAPAEPVPIHCAAGDVLLMRPLLTHASAHSRTEAGLHRRIVHVECAASPELPDGYRWHDFERLW